MYVAMVWKYLALVNCKVGFLLKKNIAAPVTRQKIRELEIIELLPHPACSLDFAPVTTCGWSTFWAAELYWNLNEVKTGVLDFFVSMTTEW